MDSPHLERALCIKSNAVRGGTVKNVRNVALEGVASRRRKRALYLRGFRSAPIGRVRLAHCSFENVAEANVVEYVDGLALEDVKRNGKEM